MQPDSTPANVAPSSNSEADSSERRSDVEPLATVSVIVPLFNHRLYIGEAIESLFAQSITPTEVIVVDDGSTDGSAQEMLSICERHPEVIFWSQPNRGAHNAINAGIFRSTGEFVSILNSDDVYEHQRIGACLSIMMANPETEMVVTRVKFIDKENHEFRNEWYSAALQFLAKSDDLALSIANANLFISTSNFFLRRSVFDTVGYFSPLRYAHDLDFALRLLANGRSIQILDQPLLRYRVHPKNTISESASQVDVERAAVFASYLYQLWRRCRSSEEWNTTLERWIEWLDSNFFLDMVSFFLKFLDNSSRIDATQRVVEAVSCWRNIEEFSPDRLTPSSSTTILGELTEARRTLLERRSQNAEAVDLIASNASIRALRDDKLWLINQNSALQAELNQRNTVILDQNAWLSELAIAKDWLAEQRENLLNELKGCSTQLAEKNTQILEQRNEIENVQRQLSAITHTGAWRLIRALRLAPSGAEEEL